MLITTVSESDDGMAAFGAQERKYCSREAKR